MEATGPILRSNAFECFKILHPVVKPAIVYDICKNSSSRQAMQLLTKLWCRPNAKTDGVCDRCSTGCSDVTVHKLSVCTTNSQARAMLQQELVMFGVAFSTQLYALSSTQTQPAHRCTHCTVSRGYKQSGIPKNRIRIRLQVLQLDLKAVLG